MSELNQVHIVWYGIATALGRIREYVAALKVLKKFCLDSQNILLSISKSAVEQQMLLDVAKVFDHARFRENENCSMKLLKETCINDTRHFPDYDKVVTEIDELCCEYERVISVKMRNKKMAHNDLKTMFGGTCSVVDLSNLVTLVERCSTIVSQIGENILGVTLKFPTIPDLEKEYEDSLNSLTNS